MNLLASAATFDSRETLNVKSKLLLKATRLNAFWGTFDNDYVWHVPLQALSWKKIH